MVLARSCGLTAVVGALVPFLNVSLATLRDWYKEADDKSGDHRRELDVTTGFGPLLRWILSDGPFRRVAVALDATSLFDRLTVLSLSIVYRGTTVPIAGKTFRANVPHPWEPEGKALLRWFHGQVDPSGTVVVLTDRGLYARWLFQAIVALVGLPNPSLHTEAGYRLDTADDIARRNLVSVPAEPCSIGIRPRGVSRINTLAPCIRSSI